MMRSHPLLVVAVLTCLAGAVGAEPAQPEFGQFPATHLRQRAPASIKLPTADTRHYAKELRRAARQPANFAGHYVLVTWGCGAGCVMGGIVDVVTGKAQMLPFTVSGWPLDVMEPLGFQANSDLLVVQGRLNEKGSGPHYFRWQGGQFASLLPGQ